jgi:signal transduction histidine kinase
MNQLLKSVRRKFIITIIAVVTAVVATTWLSLQIYNNRHIAAPASSHEVYQSAKDNEAFSAYIEQQKAFEAHFITLASDIKKQEAKRITYALAVTTAVAIGLGSIAAILATRRLIKPVEEAYRSQERFIQDAAHELRNPLATLAVALQQADKQSRKTPLYSTYQRQTKRLTSITEDLLFLEKAAKNPVQSTNISDLLLDIVEELQPLASSRDITLDAQSDPNIHKVISSSDYVRLMKNIIDNAIKYSKDGQKITIRQTCKAHTIYLTVEDAGIGIPAKDQAYIGNRFFRASNTGIIEGTGLGIAIVQKILNAYGGSLQIDSKPNKGTKVSIKLPA